MILSPGELANFADYETVVVDKSASKRLFQPVFKFVARQVPEDVAPNLISLTAMMCLVQAWYLSYTNGDAYPKETTAIAIVLILLFWTLDAVDSIHARNIGNDSSLTEFVDHMCSSVGTIFLVLTLCQCYEVQEIDSVWHYVQMGQLLILNKHLGGFKKDYISYRVFNGPGEGVTLFILMLAFRGLTGFDFDSLINTVVDVPASLLPPAVLSRHPDLFEDAPSKISRTLFFMALVWTILMTLRLGKENAVTRWTLLICCLYMLVPSGLLMFSFELTLTDVIARGMVTAMISSDLVVARMANRELHPWVVVVSMVSLVSNLFAFVNVTLYYASVLFEVSSFTRLPILSRVVNVYQDGIFDLPHIGHMKAFENAAKHGTRLFVGVVNDKDATPYKRKPIMTAKERYEAVAACKYVYKVIQDAPCTKGALDKAFIKKHRIHIVCYGEEYNTPTDEWYAVPREMGIGRVVPRHDGMSTSELIKRITTRDADELGRKSAALM
mmetsp:Transcript_22008/g.38995  ORF Transcript_22008/g.38995 Transcript_22008/m.38995 type:complete len:497 (+) Transcript_22008:215-1705(+)